MAQVVTAENNVEFITTGKVAEFKPPEESKADASPDAGTGETKTVEEKPAQAEGDLKDRNDDGTFKPKAEKSAAETDAEDAELPDRVRRQIGKKHRQMMEAQEFARERDAAAEIAEKRAAAAERELQRIRGTKSDGPSSETADAGDPAEPKPEDFKTVGEYTRALTKYEVAKAATAAKAEGEQLSAQQRKQAEADAIAKSFAERQSAYIKQNPEYEELLESSDLDVPQVAMQYIVESEVGPQLAVHLVKNPGEAERLSKLSPVRMIAELGKLETKLDSAPPPKAAAPVKQVSKAPAPIQALSSDAAAVSQKDPSQMSFAELRAFREAQKKAGTFRAS